ncbi:MAG: SdpI family protein [Candidatus Pacebacteria bacterium]|nr:SdpI family protein [Candidatus Paceibacterota bacterium]
MRKTALFISLSILIFSFASVFYFYLDLPEQIVMHWGATGQPDGFSSKNSILVLPFISLIFYIILAYVPKIDPLKENIKKFEDSYDDFILVFLLFMFYVSSLTLLWNLGLKFDMVIAIIPMFSFLFYFVGVMLDTVKRNYMIGVRTPWALASDENWERTNKMSAKVFKAVAIIILFSILVPNYSFYVLFISLTVGVAYIFIYSYLDYKKGEEGGKKKKKKDEK